MTTTTTIEERPALTIKDGVVLSFQDLGLWKGEIATDLPPAGSSPELRWTGAPIPLEALNYWSVELQEAYASGELMTKRWLETHK